MATAVVTAESAGRTRHSDGKFDPQVLFRSFDTPVPPVRVGFGYRIALLLATAVMLILPLVYLAIIALVCFGIYLQIKIDGAIFEHVHNRQAIMFLFAGPIFIWVVLLLFMIKPLVARRVDDSVPLTLRKEDEPVLFEFVHRLCRAVGAPAPSRIDVDLQVNAGAAFRRGWRGMLRGDLVLVIGLPLAAGLDAREFAGVLAHEMGHFAQGSAMRLTYVVRSLNGWFARIVYQRDKWDRQLNALCRGKRHPGILLVAWLARLLVAVTRGILWCLMYVGHAASSFMLRQMEFDADRYECRIAGSDAFEKAVARLACVNVASAVAMSDLGDAWRERRLCDDLTTLIRSRDEDMPAEVRNKILQRCSEGKTRWFHSHPCDASRIASARRENAKGVITVNAPATALFRNFPELARIATMLYYKRQIGPAFKPERLVKTEKLVESRTEQRQTFDAAQRYFRRLLSPLRPVFPAKANPPKDQSKLAEQLLELRSRLWELEPGARAAAHEFKASDGRAGLLALIRELRTAGIRKSGAKDRTVDAMNDSALKAAENAAVAARDAARAKLEPALHVALERLALALSLKTPVGASARPGTDLEVAPEDDYGEYDLADAPSIGSGDPQTDAIGALARSSEQVAALRHHISTLKILLGRIRPGTQNPKPLVDAVLWHSRKGSGLLRDLNFALGGVAYPYEHGARSLPLARYIVPGMPNANEPGSVTSAGASALDAWYTLYGRLMSDLAHRAEQIETDLGLPPIEAPVQVEEENEEDGSDD